MRPPGAYIPMTHCEYPPWSTECASLRHSATSAEKQRAALACCERELVETVSGTRPGDVRSMRPGPFSTGQDFPTSGHSRGVAPRLVVCLSNKTNKQHHCLPIPGNPQHWRHPSTLLQVPQKIIACLVLMFRALYLARIRGQRSAKQGYRCERKVLMPLALDPP